MREPAITVDASTWPLVYVMYTGARITHDDVAAYHAHLDDVLARGERFVTLIDITRVRRLPNPFVVRRIETWVERNLEALARQSLGTVTIAKNALARGVAEWVLHQRKVRSEGAVVSSLDEGVRWAMKRMRERDVPFDEALVSRALLAEDGVDVPIDPSGDALEDDDRALIELVMSAFAEPAFLVDHRGDVLFMNASANDRFARPPPWVRRALGEGHTALKALCRVVPLALGADVFIVVPSEQLLPEQGRAEVEERLELPESLLKVAGPLALGLSDREISEVTGLSHATVRTYVRRIFEKTGVHGRGAFIRRFAGTAPAPGP